MSHKASMEQVLEAVLKERLKQDLYYPQDAAPMPPSDEMRLIQYLVTRANEQWYRTQDAFVDGVKINSADQVALIKIAAVCFRALTRHGLPLDQDNYLKVWSQSDIDKK